MVRKIGFGTAFLYLFFIALALLHGFGLVKNACEHVESNRDYSKKEIILKNNALGLVFNNGYIATYYNNLQFSEDCGIACFFTVREVEYSTFKAVWKIERNTPARLSVIFEWPGLPIKQYWDFLLKDGKIIWKINLESNEDIIINHIGLVFFLKNNYREWFSPDGQGKMPVLDALQQRKDIIPGVYLNAAGLSASGKDAKLFPAVGLSLRDGVFLNEILLSSCRDLFSKDTFSSLSVGGVEPLRVFKKKRVSLSSGEMAVFGKKDDLLRSLSLK
jgi:hypothetical protein